MSDLLLSIDSSTPKLGIALSKGPRVLSYAHYSKSFQHARYIIKILDDVLRKAGAETGDIEGYVIGTGPGSFTGLRIGLTTVKALAAVYDKPIVPIISFDVIAQNFKNSGRDIHLIYDAKKGNFYYAHYVCRDGNVSRAGGPRLIKQGLFYKMIRDKCLIAGDGIALVDKELCKKQAGEIVFAQKAKWFPDVRHLAALGYQEFCAGTAVQKNEVKPFYLYPMDCSVRKKSS